MYTFFYICENLLDINEKLAKEIEALILEDRFGNFIR